MLTGLVVILASLLAVILLGLIPAINRATEQIACQTQVLASAIADLKPKPADPNEKPADMLGDIWRDFQKVDRELQEEQERVDYAARLKRAAEAELAAARKRGSPKAIIAKLEADIAALVTREAERLEANKAQTAERNERDLKVRKAQPYQFWGRWNWSEDEPWRCLGGWRSLADAVRRMEWFAQGDSVWGELEIRSDGGAVLYRYSRDEEAKKRAAKWLPNA
jgi:hypothetical protein